LENEKLKIYIILLFIEKFIFDMAILSYCHYKNKNNLMTAIQFDSLGK
jgi:hypothetical protein